VQVGLTTLTRYRHVFSPTSQVTVARLRPGEVRCAHIILAELPVPAQVTEISLATMVQAVRALVGEHFRPLRVSLPHAPVSSPDRYREYFDADVAFGEAHCSFDFRSEDLSRPLRGSDPLVREVATRYLEGSACVPPPTPETALRAIITQSLPSGRCTLVKVAHGLSVHPRTLQRHLAAQGLSFEHVVNDVRRDRARHYLENSAMPLGELSDLLGYSEQSSLTRACRVWFGVSPRSVRQAAAVPERRLKYGAASYSPS